MPPAHVHKRREPDTGTRSRVMAGPGTHGGCQAAATMSKRNAFLRLCAQGPLPHAFPPQDPRSPWVAGTTPS